MSSRLVLEKAKKFSKGICENRLEVLFPNLWSIRLELLVYYPKMSIVTGVGMTMVFVKCVVGVRNLRDFMESCLETISQGFDLFRFM